MAFKNGLSQLLAEKIGKLYPNSAEKLIHKRKYLNNFPLMIVCVQKFIVIICLYNKTEIKAVFYNVRCF